VLSSLAILVVGDLFHPVDDLTVERFLMAICVMAVVGVAPCQCFSPGGNETTSPGWISSIGPPSRCTQPQPACDRWLQIEYCPPVPLVISERIPRLAHEGCAMRPLRLRIYREAKTTFRKKDYLFIWEVVKAHVASSPKYPKTVHYRGQGVFMISGPSISLRKKFTAEHL